METTTIIIFAILGSLTGYSAMQWQLWRGRAIRMAQELQSHKNQIERVNLMWNNLHDERLRNHKAMMEVFDFLNDSQPFGSHQEQLMQCKNVLLHAIQNSTFRE
jgi:hypothetical protein